MSARLCQNTGKRRINYQYFRLLCRAYRQENKLVIFPISDKYLIGCLIFFFYDPFENAAYQYFPYNMIRKVYGSNIISASVPKNKVKLIPIRKFL